jgi:hypothetical protein
LYATVLDASPRARLLTRRQLLKTAGGAAGVAALGGAAFGATRLSAGGPSFRHLPSFASTGKAGSARAFVSRPDLRPPAVLIGGHGAAPGYLFVGPGTKGVTQPGPLLIDEQGEPVWFRPTRPLWLTNFRLGQYRDRPVLTWWEGVMTVQGFGRGEGVVLDRAYREVARVRAVGQHHIDAHEFLLTPEGTALFVCYPSVVPADLSPIGGPTNGAVLESIIQEVDVRTGRLLFKWRSLDHIPLDETYQRPAVPMDYLHVNSIDVMPDGNLLVSGRCTWTLYKLDRKSGQVIWRLGGKHSDFRMSPGASFAWQHGAAQPTESTITLFDNGDALWDDDSGFSQTESQSRGMLLEIDETNRTARLVRSYRHHPPLLANAMGNVQTLPDGHLLVGWGSNPYVTEFAADGRVIADINLGFEHNSYRAYRYPWTGVPADPPILALRRDSTSGKTIAYVSWNGATTVSHWLLHAGPRPEKLRTIGVAARRGFETVIPLPARDAYVRATALDASGQTLASSEVTRL